MSTSIKVIKFTTVLSACSLLLTYIISLNMELHFIKLNSPLISNNFCFTVAGGFFASMLIVQICELQKYLIIKKETENFLFGSYGMLYGELLTIRWSLQVVNQDHSQIVPDKLLGLPMDNVRGQMAAIFPVDYSVFTKQNDMQTAHNDYKNNGYTELWKFLNDCRNLEIAVNLDRQAMLIANGFAGNTTCDFYYTGRAVTILLEKIEKQISYYDLILEKIDDSCNNRFNWREVKKNIQQPFSDLRAKYVDDFFAYGIK